MVRLGVARRRATLLVRGGWGLRSLRIFSKRGILGGGLDFSGKLDF
jgi:hypothetical protein